MRPVAGRRGPGLAARTETVIDTPILALTRARAGGLSGLSPAASAAENMRLLVQLRWIAVAGQLVTIVAVERFLGVPLPLVPMLAVVGVLVLANLFFLRLSARGPINRDAIFLTLLFDVTALGLQLYLSGGAANPFISLFLLQLVLGAILLDAVRVVLLGAVTVAAHAALVVWGVPLAYPPQLESEVISLERLGALISFALTGALLAIFITRIIRNLRARDAWLAELRQRAAEEEGIVRMGLLASGAAHELGTPLSSLSVILNDWSRMPRVADDQELAAELGEMQREVSRCKAIVSDVLHSAGAPRGDDTLTMPAAAYIEAVADAWRPTHPATLLTFTQDGLEGAMLLAEPAIRQAIVNLLDNAAEVSPGGVSLSAHRTPDGLTLAVTDDGPGFTEAQLAQVGKPYQSSKGAGRGLGLFLAASLARRLGGRLAAANRPDGGAEVRLVLPLAADPSIEE